VNPRDWRRSRLGNYLRHIPRPKHLKGTWLHRKLGDGLLDPALWRPDDRGVAAGFALGAFFSMLPIPLQMLPASVLAWLTRSNIPAAIVGCWISNPITAAFFFFLQYQIGRLLLGMGAAPDSDVKLGMMELLKQAPMAVLLGSVIMGMVMAAIGYPSSFYVWRKIRGAVQRSAERRRKPRVVRSVDGDGI